MTQPEIKVALRLTGDELVPAEISSALCCEPSAAHARGDEIESKRFIRKAPTGVWILRSDPVQTIDEAIEKLLNKVNVDATVWETLTKRFRAEFFVGLFSDTNQVGFTVQAPTLEMPSKLGIAIAFDIYCNGTS